MNYTNPTDSGEMSIADILTVIGRHRIMIAMLVILCSLLMLFKTIYLTRDTYTSFGVMHISNKPAEKEAETTIQQNDIETSKSLSTTYTEILKTRVFLEDVSKAIGNKYTGEQISKMLTVSQVNDTELLKISVTTHDAFDSFILAKSIMNKAPDKLTSVYKSGEVEIVDPPQYNEKPDDKGFTKNIALGFMLGLMLSCTYAFVYEFFDKRVHKAEDVAARYDISILGETAQGRVKKRRKKGSDLSEEAKKIINANTDFDTVETYKSIRTNIMFSMPKPDRAQNIVVTSASPEEGKTTTVINLAITFAQTGAKVIIIDCDLRKARVHRYLGLSRKDGVSNVVCGYAKLDEAIKRNVRDNLDCLTAGEIPPNPAELLQTEEYVRMLKNLESQYDYIFTDTPPITVVTDAAVLMKHCDGAVIVARNEMTTYDLLDAAVNEVKNSGAPLLGAIVHDSSEKQKKYGYYRGGKIGKYKYDYVYGDAKNGGKV